MTKINIKGSFKLRFPVEFFIELILFLKKRKKFWLLPIILVMVILGGLIILAEGSIVAPFIYTLW